MGIGILSMVVPMYISETAPTAVRGRMIAVQQLMVKNHLVKIILIVLIKYILIILDNNRYSLCSNNQYHNPERRKRERKRMAYLLGNPMRARYYPSFSNVPYALFPAMVGKSLTIR